MEIKDFNDLMQIWNNGGRLNDEIISLKDALATPDAALMLPKVISNIVKEAQEPYLIGTSLMNVINYTAGVNITFPAVGALQAADIAEGQEYPEQRLAVGGASATAKVGKSGLAVKLTEEMIRHSQWDVIGMHLRAAGRALARLKEQKIFHMIRSNGTPVFDNAAPTKSLNGVTTGRGFAGNGNGSVTMDDLMDTYIQISLNGFSADTIMVHPLSFGMWLRDPVMRSFALQSGGGSFFNMWTGQAATQAPWGASSQGGLGHTTGQSIVPPGGSLPASPLSAYSQTMTSAPKMPSYANGLPFRVLVSPFVPFDPKRRTTDVYMFDSKELGALVVDEEVTTEEFKDPSTDIYKIKLRERYGLAILNEGLGCGVLRNVKVAPNEIVLPAQASIDVSASSLGPIGRNDNVLD